MQIYKEVIDEKVTGRTVYQGGHIGKISFGKKDKEDVYISKNFFPLWKADPVPIGKVFIEKTVEFDKESKRVIEKNIYREYNEEELQGLRIEAFNDAKREAEQLVDYLIHQVFEEYNTQNGTLFEDINALPKYVLNPNSPHKVWAEKVIFWVDDLWNVLRQIQKEVIDGERGLPNKEEILGELPKF